MTYPLFNRYWSLMVNDGNEQRTYQGDMDFTVSKTADTTPNELEIVLYNLNDSSRKFLDRRNLNVELTAGYQDGFGLIFKGNTELSDHTRALPGWTSNILCLDGGAALRNLTINETVKEGQDIKNVIDKLIKSLQNVPPGIESQLAEINRLTKETIALASFKPKTQPKKGKQTKVQGKQTDIEQQKREYLKKSEALEAAADVRKMERAKTLRGQSIKALKSITDALGLILQINDQKISIYPPGATVTAGVINLTPRSGLIGSPRKQDNGYVVNSLLRHEFNPGQPLAVDSETLKGILAIARVDHRGSTRSDEWHSEAHLIEL